jgi:hypothetical protein
MGIFVSMVQHNYDQKTVTENKIQINVSQYNRVSQKMKSVDCSSVNLLILMQNLSTDLDFLKLPFMLLFCVPDLQ